MFHYFSFGHLPSGRRSTNLRGKLRGAPNLFKRLQAREIMACVNPQPGEKILDFGCGSGFFTYEFARYGARATGLDIVPLPASPEIKSGQLDFITVQPDAHLPFRKNTFDKIFISEVLIILPDPAAVLRRLLPALKPGGKLIIVNTLGRKQIETAYAENSPLLRMLRRFGKNAPATYEEFCSYFLDVDGIRKRQWYTEDEIRRFVEQAGFADISVTHPFSKLPFSILYWMQFAKLSCHRSISLKFGLIRYLLLEFLKPFCGRRDPSNIILCATKTRE